LSTAHDLPLVDAARLYGEPIVAPTLRLVPAEPLDFDDAVARVRPRLLRYAARRLGDLHEAEELVQEALLRAYTHREQLPTEEDLSAWTTVVTGRLVIDRLRVRGRSTSVADVPEGARVGRDTADIVVARDEARTALDALDAMPARQAALLWAREVEGRSYQDLCDRFTMTEPAVRSVLTRARKALRKEYALRGGTLPVGGLAVLAPWVISLGWAEKLRRVAARVTAPAVLGAVGITALGGLMLSPFGAGSAPATGTFHPSQSVVANAVSGRTPVAPAHTTATRPAVRAKTPATAGSGGVWVHAKGTVDRPLKPLNEVPCESRPPLVPTPSGHNLPTSGLNIGGSTCTPRKNRISVAVPGGQVTGYNEFAAETDDVDCSPLNPATTLAASPVHCSHQETQP
jgi:RNA polymerase sigma-70 factor (ECF subfamily)